MDWQIALEILEAKWNELCIHAREGAMYKVLSDCRVLLNVLAQPEQLKHGDCDIAPGASDMLRFWIMVHLEKRQFRNHFLSLIISVTDQLLAVMAHSGEVVLAAEVRRIQLRAQNIKNNNQHPHFFDSELSEFLRRRFDLRQFKIGTSSKQHFAPSKIETLIAFLQEKTGSPEWTREKLLELSPEDCLIVAVGKPGELRSVVYQNSEAEIIEHRVSFDQLANELAILRRELERGNNHVGSKVKIWQEVLASWPSIQGTLYFIGLGIFQALPVRAMNVVPTVCLHNKPRFHLPVVSRFVKGTALYSFEAPQPLSYTQKECGELPNFAVKRATRNNVIEALFGYGPVHIAAHAQVVGFETDQTKLVLKDGDLTVTDLTRLRGMQAPIVYLSACETGVKSLVNETMPSLAEALLQSGVGAVIASKWRIPDDVSVVIAQQFWTMHRNGLSAQHALHHMTRMIDTVHALAFELFY